MLSKLLLFIEEARQELRRVNWPTRAETMRLTLAVIFISIALAVFLGIFDFIFIYALQKLI